MYTFRLNVGTKTGNVFKLSGSANLILTTVNCVPTYPTVQASTFSDFTSYGGL